MTMLLPVLAFLLVAALVGAGAMALAPSTSAIEERLGEVMGEAARPVPATSAMRDAVMDWLERLGAVAPRSTAEMSRLQQRLVTAGYRRREAVIVFFGLRIVIAIGAFLLFESPIVARPNFLLALAACGSAYVLPGFVLAPMGDPPQP